MALSSLRPDNASLADKAAEQIILFIQENELQRGDRLPNEKSLGDRLHVSRSTIREAMRMLTSRGIVVVKQGSGTYIASTPGVAEDPLGLEFKYDKGRVLHDLLEVRFLLEPQTAALCAERATDEEIQRLLKQAEAVERCIETGTDHTEEDAKFHCMIAELSRNEILMIIYPEIIKSVRLFSIVLEKRIIHTVTQAHWAIARAIADRDAEGAKAAMREHLECNQIAIEQYLKQENKQI